MIGLRPPGTVFLARVWRRRCARQRQRKWWGPRKNMSIVSCNPNLVGLLAVCNTHEDYHYLRFHLTAAYDGLVALQYIPHDVRHCVISQAWAMSGRVLVVNLCIGKWQLSVTGVKQNTWGNYYTVNLCCLCMSERTFTHLHQRYTYMY